MLNPPPPWTNQPIVLYHGTLDVHASLILQSGINVGSGMAGKDFGRGFYTTTVRQQADDWAWKLSRQSGGTQPGVLEISIDRSALAELDTLAFVRGERDADDFWSLVAHCRSGADDHGRSAQTAHYDVVVGPVAAFWEQRAAMLGADQVSFHTRRAEEMLNSNRVNRRRVW
ncbi:MAG TPA: DUF3990 domain-containing protein [Longimicrobium sp.]|jgi:hypothetical protein|nr:DUF3990 domain-containing protein [Longimicrobium sp.]